MADVKKPPIEWHRIGWRWWLEGAAKLTVWAAIFAGIVAIIGEGQPKWVSQVSAISAFVIGILLIPELPRQGEEPLSLKDSLLGTGAIVITIAGALTLIAALFLIPGVISATIGPIFAPLADWVVRHFTLDTILLLIIIFMLIDIYGRLGRRA